MTRAAPAPAVQRSFSIRSARPEDADAIAAVHRASVRDAMPWLPDLHTPDEDRAWVRQIVLPRQQVWVAEVGGEIVGVSSLDADNFLTQLYILPGYQGMGIGSTLIAEAKEARPDGFRLYAFQRNARARRFYEWHGFTAIAFGDGSGNEEGEPDVLYAWTPERSPL